MVLSTLREKHQESFPKEESKTKLNQVCAGTGVPSAHGSGRGEQPHAYRGLRLGSDHTCTEGSETAGFLCLFQHGEQINGKWPRDAQKNHSR